MTIPRSWLYVPGDRPDRLTKAAGRGPDAIIADLEDAVAPADKDAALAQVATWLDIVPADGPQVWVRVNTANRREAELRELGAHPAVTGFFLPKTDHSDEVAAAVAAAPRDDLRWAPMIESAVGLVNIHGIAAAPRVYQLHIGEMDLAADLGLAATDGEEELLHARSLLVIASRAAELIPPAAPVSSEINDLDRYRSTTARLKALGFYGRDCIHPVQVAASNIAFTATADELAWAADVLDRADTSPGSFRDRDGAMVDEAILRRARRIAATQTL